MQISLNIISVELTQNTIRGHERCNISIQQGIKCTAMGQEQSPAADQKELRPNGQKDSTV